MKFSDENLYTMSEANSNFSKITRAADRNGYAAIIKNSKISYVLLPYDKVKTEEILRDEDMEEVARRLIEKIKDEYNIQLKLDIE